MRHIYSASRIAVGLGWSSTLKRIAPALLVLSGMLAAGTSSAATLIDPEQFDCNDYLHADGVSQSWQQMIQVEQCDRIKRLARLSRMGTEPQFFIERIPREKLPPEVGVDVPLLRVVFPQRVFFDTAESGLRPEAMEVVRVVSESLRHDVPDVALFVAGHTDARGARAYNQGLSVDRANAVAEQILAQGVNLATVWRIGFGPDMPLVANTDPETWGYNRRVEFLFAGSADAIAVWLADMQVDGLCSGASRRDTAECRRTLQLRTDYEAVEVRAAAREVAPAPAGARSTAPQAAGQRLAPTVTSAAAVKPVSGRRIVINPVNRTANHTLSQENNG